MNVIKQTKRDIAALKKLDVQLTQHLRLAFAANDLAKLELNGSKTLGRVTELLRAKLVMMRVTEASALGARTPLISERYVKTLADTIAKAHREGAFTWLMTTRQALQEGYMMASPASFTLHEKHPGSSKGVVIIDLRDWSAFMDESGKVTHEAIRARVAGHAKPRG